MKERKLYIFIGTLLFGGAERVVSVLSKGLIGKFSSIEIVMYHNKDMFYKIDDRIKVTSIVRNTGSRNIIKNMFYFRKYIEKDSIVLSFLTQCNIFAILSLFLKKQILIVANRNDPYKTPNNFFIRKIRNFLYYYPNRIICQTKDNKEYFSKKLQKKIDVISNPIFISEDSGSALNEEKKREVVSVGRLVKQKNQKLLIDSFELVLQKYPDYKLIIYGEGKERNTLEKYIKNKQLSNSIILPGAYKNIHEKIKKSKIFVLTSKYEGMPNSLLEAMCLGLPCISTKVSGAKEFIKNNENGLLIDENKEELAEKICNLLENKKKAELLGKNAAELYKKLKEEKIIKEWEKILLKYKY